MGDGGGSGRWWGQWEMGGNRRWAERQTIKLQPLSKRQDLEDERRRLTSLCVSVSAVPPAGFLGQALPPPVPTGVGNYAITALCLRYFTAIF